MIQRLIDFLNASPVNFLAIKTLKEELEKAGFQNLDPSESLDGLKPGSQFYVTKNDSSLYAFHLGNEPLQEGGFHIICAHCDSPTFRIKPNAEITSEGMVRLNTEVYGGPIMSTWFDRPLSLAGRVILRTEDPMHPETRLLHVKRPILGIVENELEKGNLLIKIITDELGIKASDILDFDLYLYDVTPACTFGVHNEFISSGRLDDLSMVFAGLEALLKAGDGIPKHTQVLAIFDNEETGSQTKQGAGSPFLSSILKRIVLAQGGKLEDYYRSVEQAFMVSADNAHAWHPNYNEKYDPTNHPVLGGGPVIKYNAAQKYASDAVSGAIFANICETAGVPCQRFVNHSDVAGGSTLGNILAGSLPLRGVDMGNPILAMHSARETGAVRDHEYCVRAFTRFYQL